MLKTVLLLKTQALGYCADPQGGPRILKKFNILKQLCTAGTGL